jgi:lipopolysaccharide/colanic/teichoic acid biosynthesis glycosyltransferase
MYKGKRIFDIIASLSGLIILSPLLILISLLVLSNSGYPVIYRQKRVGKNWKIFNLYKFRTMMVDTEAEGYICKKDDIRVTSIGRLLRRCKLDELPQLFNVLKGDMSIVGPRPEILEFAERYKVQFQRILIVKPGITDPASLHFRNEPNLIGNVKNTNDYYLKEILTQKIKINYDYIKKTNFFYDINLILKTLISLLSNR